VVDHLPHESKALSSNFSTKTKKQRHRLCHLERPPVRERSLSGGAHWGLTGWEASSQHLKGDLSLFHHLRLCDRGPVISSLSLSHSLVKGS
jgi:hypothetical protein